MFQLSLLTAPIITLLLLSKRNIYPNKHTLLLLFPLTLLPLTLFLHKPLSISFSHLWSLLFVNLAIYCLLTRKRSTLSFIAIIITLLSLTVINKQMYSTALFTVISLLLSSKKSFWVQKPLEKSLHAKKHGPIPSFRFYNKYMQNN